MIWNMRWGPEPKACPCFFCNVPEMADSAMKFMLAMRTRMNDEEYAKLVWCVLHGEDPAIAYLEIRKINPHPPSMQDAMMKAYGYLLPKTLKSDGQLWDIHCVRCGTQFNIVKVSKDPPAGKGLCLKCDRNIANYKP